MAGSVIGALRVNLGLDSAKFEAGAKRAGAAAGGLASKFGTVQKAAAVLDAVFAALSAGAIRGAAEIDRVAKAAQRVGASIGGFRALELAAGEAGVPLEQVTDAAQMLGRELAKIGTSGNAGRALKQLGLTVGDLAGMGADEKLALIADRIKAMGISSGAASALLQDFGIRSKEMVLLMMAGGDAIRDARADIEDYGLALSSVDAKKIEEANDRIGRLSIVGTYLGQKLAQLLVPAFGRLAKAITDSMRAGGLLRGVIDAVFVPFEYLSRIIGAVVNIIGSFVGAIRDAVTGSGLFKGAVQGMKDALDFIVTPFRTVLGFIPRMLFGFSDLITGAGGFGEALGMLADVAREIFGRVGDAFKLIPAAIRVGATKMQVIWLQALNRMLAGFIEMTWAVAEAMNSVFKTNLQGASFGPTQEMAGQILSAADALDAATASYSELQNNVSAPLQSVEALRTTIAGVRAETEGAAVAAEDFGDALETTGGAAGKALSQAQTFAKSVADTLKGAFSSLFEVMFEGGQKVGEVLTNLGKKLAAMGMQEAVFRLLASAMPKTFGQSGFIPLVGGNANGTQSWGGGLSMVGERGPELLNIPRGSSITPANDTARMMRGGGTVVNISNYTGQPARAERTRGPDGREMVRVIVGEEMARGSFDAQNRSRYGAKPQGVKR